MHEAVDGAYLPVVDCVAGEGVGGGVEVVEDAAKVLHLDEGDQRDLAPVVRRHWLEGAQKAALVMRVAELAVFECRHGAAGAVDADMCAAFGHGGFLS